MTYGLTLIVCLLSAPDDCRSVRFGEVPYAGAAVAAAADWTSQNPGWFVSKMRLTPGGLPAEQDA